MKLSATNMEKDFAHGPNSLRFWNKEKNEPPSIRKKTTILLSSRKVNKKTSKFQLVKIFVPKIMKINSVRKKRMPKTETFSNQ